MSIKRKNDVEILSEKIFPKSVCSKVTNPLPNVSSENVRLNVNSCLIKSRLKNKEKLFFKGLENTDVQ